MYLRESRKQTIVWTYTCVAVTMFPVRSVQRIYNWHQMVARHVFDDIFIIITVMIKCLVSQSPICKCESNRLSWVIGNMFVYMPTFRFRSWVCCVLRIQSVVRTTQPYVWIHWELKPIDGQQLESSMFTEPDRAIHVLATIFRISRGSLFWIFPVIESSYFGVAILIDRWRSVMCRWKKACPVSIHRDDKIKKTILAYS